MPDKPPSPKTPIQLVNEIRDGINIEDNFARLSGLFRKRWHFQGFGASIQDSEDLTQQTLVQMYRGIGAFKGDNDNIVIGWVLGTARNIWQNHSRAQRTQMRDKRLETSLETFSSPDSSAKPDKHTEISEPRDEIAGLIAGDAIRRAMKKLSPKQRQAFKYWAADCGYEEIAQLMDIPLGTARSLIFYSKKIIQKEIGDPGLGR